ESLPGGCAAAAAAAGSQVRREEGASTAQRSRVPAFQRACGAAEGTAPAGRQCYHQGEYGTGCGLS
ncbi:unnamed protein product, partial [Closterium sp. NIES-53]